MTRAEQGQSFDEMSTLPQWDPEKRGSSSVIRDENVAEGMEDEDEDEHDDEDEGEDEDEDEDEDEESTPDEREGEGQAEKEEEGPKDRPNAGEGYDCDICGKIFSEHRKLAKHKRNVHLGRRCAHCDKMFQTASVLWRHVKSQHEDLKPLPCPAKDCKYSNPLEDQVRLHMERQHIKMAAEFSAKGSIEEYSLSQHSAVEYEVSRCPYCSLTFTTPEDLMRHMSTHEAEGKRLLCPGLDCEKSFATKAAMVAHIRKLHPRFDVVKGKNRREQNPHPCQQCNKTFLIPSELERHANTHLIERERFPCADVQCNRTFTQKYTLNKHIETKHPDSGIVKEPSTS